MDKSIISTTGLTKVEHRKLCFSALPPDYRAATDTMILPQHSAIKEVGGRLFIANMGAKELTLISPFM